MKKFIFTILTAITGHAVPCAAQDQNLPSLVIGGIEVRGLTANEDILRSIVYKSVVSSKKYVVYDRYDVAEILGAESIQKCMGKKCLVEAGKRIQANFALSASYEALGDRILVSMKIVDVATGEVKATEIEEFENQPRELNRMTDLMVFRLMNMEIDPVVARILIYKNNPAASAGLGKLNNSGPRMGGAIILGENGKYFTRNERDGGLGTIPLTFNIGYQLEAQYVGGERFSGLFEFIGNIAGVEHGTVVPSLAILHGIRWGKGAWEFAMGPSLSIKQLATGTDDYKGTFHTQDELSAMGVTNEQQQSFVYYKRPDTRGDIEFSPNFIVGIGKTFRPGAINVPLNIYASLNKYGTSVGLSLGINITRSRKYNVVR